MVRFVIIVGEIRWALVSPEEAESMLVRLASGVVQGIGIFTAEVGREES
jgi:hypothetical protein